MNFTILTKITPNNFNHHTNFTTYLGINSNNYSILCICSTIEKKEDLLLNACKGFGLALNTGKTMYMEIGRNRGIAANKHIRIDSNS